MVEKIEKPVEKPEDPNKGLISRIEQMEQSILGLNEKMEKLSSPAAREKLEEKITALEKELAEMKKKAGVPVDQKPEEKKPTEEKKPEPAPKKSFWDEE